MANHCYIIQKLYWIPSYNNKSRHERKGRMKLIFVYDIIVYINLSSPKYINNALKMIEEFIKMAYCFPHWL